jgi:hypothetical protein
MKLRFAHLLLAAGILILPLACQNGGIYWTLQNEVKIDDLSLPNEITVFDVTKIDGPPDTYYAAAGKIWTSDATSISWNKDVRVVGPTTDAMCTALVSSPFGTKDTLFGGFIRPEANLGLYESDANPTVAFSTSNWHTVADPVVAGAQVVLLKSQNDGSPWLVVVTARHTTGENYVYGIAGFDGVAWAPFDTSVRASPEDQTLFHDVIWAPTFGRWVATSGAKLFVQLGDPGVGAFIEYPNMTNIATGDVLTGLFDDGTNVYLASEGGSVYYANAYNTDWTRIAAPAVSGVNPPLTRFAGPVTGVSDDYLLVGSEGYGYYRLPVSPTIGSLTRCPDTTDTLHTASVLKMYFDGAISPDRVFACTSNEGLWRGDQNAAEIVDPDLNYGWVQE